MNAPYALPGYGPMPQFEAREAAGWLPRGWIAGLKLSNDGTDATNDIGISAGACRSTSNIGPQGRSTLGRHQMDMEIPVAIIKQLDVAWASENYDPAGYSGGGRSGMRSSSSISDTTWHIFVIGGRGRKTDILAHTGVDPSAILPSGYTAWRRTGSVIRSSSAILAFTQYGDYFAWTSPPLDINTGILGATRVTSALTVPIGVRVIADMNFITAAANGVVYVNHPGSTDSAASVTAAPLAAVGNNTAVETMAGRGTCMTDTLGQISYRGSTSGLTFRVGTLGYWDSRGRDD